MIPDRTLALLLRIGLPVALLIGGWLAWQWHGAEQYRAGVAAEKARWEVESKIERARQAGARETTEQLGRQVVAEVVTKIAELQPILADIKTEATKEDATPIAPLPPGCPPLDGGLPADSLWKLESVR